MIGVVVRREALKRRPLTAFRCEGDMPAGGADVAPSVGAFVDMARSVGQGLVEAVEVEADRLAALA